MVERRLLAHQREHPVHIARGVQPKQVVARRNVRRRNRELRAELGLCSRNGPRHRTVARAVFHMGSPGFVTTEERVVDRPKRPARQHQTAFTPKRCLAMMRR